MIGTHEPGGLGQEYVDPSAEIQGVFAPGGGYAVPSGFQLPSFYVDPEAQLRSAYVQGGYQADPRLLPRISSYQIPYYALPTALTQYGLDPATAWQQNQQRATPGQWYGDGGAWGGYGSYDPGLFGLLGGNGPKPWWLWPAIGVAALAVLSRNRAAVSRVLRNPIKLVMGAPRKRRRRRSRR